MHSAITVDKMHADMSVKNDGVEPDVVLCSVAVSNRLAFLHNVNVPQSIQSYDG